ncbi:MAG: N-formylglutamate amidohydrolase [Rhodobacteraceae bacterium]|nr:N-formylglutamate amidohydrolase [Paracoccaceae bacterium]
MIHVKRGQAPLVICLPHSGTDIPPVVASRLSANGSLQTDIAWLLPKIFELPENLDVTIISSSISRYVIDVDKSLYPVGEEQASCHALCPLTTYDTKRIYAQGEEPGAVEIEQRQLLFYKPFYNAVERELARLRKIYDRIVMLNCSSIQSQFRGPHEDEIPLINIETDNGDACDEALPEIIAGSFEQLADYSVSVDKFVTGGELLRRFAAPGIGVHGASVTVAQRAYLAQEAPPFQLDPAKAPALTDAMAAMACNIQGWLSGGLGLSGRAAADN